MVPAESNKVNTQDQKHKTITHEQVNQSKVPPDVEKVGNVASKLTHVTESNDSIYGIRNISQCIEQNTVDGDDVSSSEFCRTNEAMRRCRFCLGIVNLTSIFDNDSAENIAASIMLLCPSIKIFRKDNLPHFICETCLQSLRVAINLKNLGETTDKELRSKSKQTRKIRETELVIINCSGEGEIEENVDVFSEDEDFHPPTDYDKSENDSNSDSSYEVKKYKTRRSARTTRKNSLNITGSSRGIARKSKMRKPGKAKRTGGSTTKDELHLASKIDRLFKCVYCDQQFPVLEDLREHKKKHIGEKPFQCGLCDRTFKFLGSYKSHQEKHSLKDDLTCHQCSKRYSNKTELKRHLIDVHNEVVAKFVCFKCKRSFTSEKRLLRHKEGNCSSIETIYGKEKKNKTDGDAIALGRDLFKCVAPLTTTYWSDSFSD